MGQKITKLFLLLTMTLCCPSCEEETPGLAEISIYGALPDMQAESLGATDPSMRQVLALLLYASRDENLSGMLVHIGNLEAGPARLEELRQAFQRVRDAGKLVHCHLSTASNFSYWLAATSCDRVTLSPGGTLDLVGLAAESIYVQDLLDSLGLEADVLQVGTHKGAAEFLTHDEMTPETRETLDEVLDDLTAMLVAGIAEGRGLDEATVRDMIEEGPYWAESAAAARLIDATEYQDQALDQLEQAVPGQTRMLEHYTLTSQPQIFGSSAPSFTGQPRVAVLYLSGSIGTGPGGASIFGSTIGLNQVQEALEAIEDDETVRALVVRIESPGGSATVSDEIWHAILNQRNRIPVVASMGDVAASGGYYIAAAASEIYAQPGTLAGSIGVIGGKLVTENLMDSVGATPILIQRGQNAALTSMSRPFSPSERQALQRQMQAIYDRFVDCIVRSRAMDEQTVRQLATGRVWTGSRALELGLVDQLGGLHDAIVRARELGGLEEDAPVEAFPRARGLFEQLTASPSPMGMAMMLARGTAPAHIAASVSTGLSTAELLSREPVLAYCPLHVSIR